MLLIPLRHEYRDLPTPGYDEEIVLQGIWFMRSRQCACSSGERGPVGLVVDAEETDSLFEEYGLTGYIRESDDDELLDCAGALNW